MIRLEFLKQMSNDHDLDHGIFLFYDHKLLPKDSKKHFKNLTIGNTSYESPSRAIPIYKTCYLDLKKHKAVVFLSSTYFSINFYLFLIRS